jgi:flagellar hook-length control protein FliK
MSALPSADTEAQAPARMGHPLPEQNLPAAPPPASPATERQALPVPTLIESESAITADTPAPLHVLHQDTTTPANFEPAILRASEAYSRNAAPVTQASIEAPVRSPAFLPEFADKVVWMAGRREQWAELSLNPANLGTVEIRLSLTEDGAGAQFFSPHPQVREVLEAALPRLREMLSQAGISLQDASVRDQALPQREGSGHWGDAPGGRRNDQNGEGAPSPMLAAMPRSRPMIGLVDFYA